MCILCFLCYIPHSITLSMHKFWYCHNLIRVWHPYHACRSGTKSSPMQMRLYLLVLNMAMELTMSKIGFYQKFLLVHHIIQKYYLIPSCEMIYCFLYLMFSMLKSTSLWWTSHLLSVNIMIFLIWFFKFLWKTIFNWIGCNFKNIINSHYK